MKSLIIDKNDKNLKLCGTGNGGVEYLYFIEPTLVENNQYDCTLEADNLIINLNYPIRFIGNLFIYGNIESQNTISAENIYADGNITVQGHIFCKTISSHKNIIASRINAFGNIEACNINTVLCVETFGHIEVKNQIKTSSLAYNSINAKEINAKEINGEDTEM